ncbi:capsular biosynthesis protein, partial [Cronobacter dublinensis]|nr:capsular biosynthesis protein [Cronobacter dublinensis]
DDGETIILELPESSIDLTDLVKKQFETTSFSFKEILALTATLFLSMLPLHYDRPDRQLAFVATAINLYKEFKK